MTRVQTSAVGLAKRIGHLLRLGHKPTLQKWPLVGRKPAVQPNHPDGRTASGPEIIGEMLFEASVAADLAASATIKSRRLRCLSALPFSRARSFYPRSGSCI